MFNFLMHHDEDFWDARVVDFTRTRAFEYTIDKLNERYRDFSQSSIEEMKNLPTIFSVEQEAVLSRIGYITDIVVGYREITISFEFDPILPPIEANKLKEFSTELDIKEWELYRTHWAIKDVNIFNVLLNNELISQEQLDASMALRVPAFPDPDPVETAEGEFNNSQVFIVHGHDETGKIDIATFISELGLEPIILHKQASSGMTIIEKIEHYSNVGYGVVLYTPCDFGAKLGSMTTQFRARQNVVFEHGYLIGKLKRERVMAIVKGELETPNDISGVVYIEMKQDQAWKDEIRKELLALNYNI